MTVTIHNPPASNPTSSLYTVTVDGVSAGTYATDLGHFINYSTDEDTVVVVTFNTTVSTAVLSPRRKGIPVQIAGSTVTFTLSGENINGNYVLEINDPGQTDDAQTPTWAPLFIFANPLEINPPTADTATIKYLGPGNWYVSSSTVITSGLPGTVSDNYYDVAQGKQLYLAPGAVLRGKLKIGSDTSGNSGGTGSTSGKIFGRGIVDATYAPTFGRVLRVNNSSNIAIDGIVFINKQHWAVNFRLATNCTINNIKVISQRVFITSAMTGTPDGIDLSGCQGITVTNSFVRSYDDGITVKADTASPGGWARAVNNITYDGMVIYQGWGGNAMEIGAEVPQNITGVTFRNIDVIAKKSRTGDAANVANIRDALSINVGSVLTGGTVTNVLYENIYVEKTTPNFIGIFSAVAGGIVNGVTYRNINFFENATDKVINIQGFDANTKVQNVVFDGLRFGGPTNGKIVGSMAALNVSPASDVTGFRNTPTFTNLTSTTSPKDKRLLSLTLNPNVANSFSFDYSGQTTGRYARFYVSNDLAGGGFTQVGQATFVAGAIRIDLSRTESQAIAAASLYKLEVADAQNVATLINIGRIFLTVAATQRYDNGSIGAGGITFDRKNAEFQTATLTANSTLNISTATPSIGNTLRLQLVQDATGSRVATWGSNIKTAGTLTLSTTANANDVITFVFDGTNWREISRSLGQAA